MEAGGSADRGEGKKERVEASATAKRKGGERGRESRIR